LDRTYDLFLGHANEDEVFTDPLADKLRSLGLEVWYANDDLRKGEQVRDPEVTRYTIKCTISNYTPGRQVMDFAQY